MAGSTELDEIDPDLSYEVIVDRHPGRFNPEVIDAARQHLHSEKYANNVSNKSSYDPWSFEEFKKAEFTILANSKSNK